MSKTRSRRLRKKLFVDEFQELGFDVDLSFSEPAGTDRIDAFFERFFTEAIMPEGLVFGGRDDAGFVCSSRRGSVSEAQRSAVSDWLDGQPALRDFRVGPLMDVWHD
ncbi:DUF469 family protein [Nitrogeniibacter mangrovi]|uniref:DUF469 family protein n=1 Tax=Nitrogeniibacter mangrovi TaxID=2016596 RepID=A0A6C1B6U7_9RHOO|nr:YggL family protein [Nitrogeniibacter mangrovi]QID19187.1 DUF469 family protein [Nitrogeniibacter mangrovi]